MPSVGFEPTISVLERMKTGYAVATVIGEASPVYHPRLVRIEYKGYVIYLEFEILTAVVVKNFIFWNSKSDEIQTTFLRNMLPPSSRCKKNRARCQRECRWQALFDSRCVRQSIWRCIQVDTL
jgi:hypothetical protein